MQAAKYETIAYFRLLYRCVVVCIEAIVVSVFFSVVCVQLCSKWLLIVASRSITFVTFLLKRLSKCKLQKVFPHCIAYPSEAMQ